MCSAASTRIHWAAVWDSSDAVFDIDCSGTSSCLNSKSMNGILLPNNEFDIHRHGNHLVHYPTMIGLLEEALW